MDIKDTVLEYFKGDELATEVFLKKYSLEGKETPEDMFKRLLDNNLRIEKKYALNYEGDYDELSQYGQDRALEIEHFIDTDFKNYIYPLTDAFKYIIYGGSVMSGLGSDKPVCLSNCLVVDPPEDNIESIFNTARDIAQIFKRRGGVGIDISNLRPQGAVVNNAANTSSGAVSFMELYSKVTEIIGQSGRRGALMLSIKVNHPDVEYFATIKNDLSKVTGANVSVRFNDEFLEAVEKDEDYILSFPCRSSKEVQDGLFDNGWTLDEFEYNKLYSLNWATTKYFKKVRAKDLYDTIMTSAHKSGEPGVLNDTLLTNYDPASVYKELIYKGLNPCAEQPLGAYDTCRLLCVNLFSLVDNPFTKDANIDYKKAYSIFYEALVMGDNLVDLEIEAIDKILKKIEPEYEYQLYKEGINNVWYDSKASDEFKLWWKIRDKAIKGRRVGAGITGYADMLAALGKSYGDKEVTEQLFYIKLEAELDATIDLAILRGSFPLWNKELEYQGEKHQATNDWYQFVVENYPDQFDRMIKYGRRNVNFSTIAPTGSISILTQTTSGIEPLFMPYYTRRKKCNPEEKADFTDENGVEFKEFTVVHPKLIEWYNSSLPIKSRIPAEELTEKQWSDLFRVSPWDGQIASDINWKRRVETQGLIQQYITSSISSTVNLPKDTPKETVSNIYKEAFKQGCKGITVYVDGSRSGVLVGTEDKKEFQYHSAPKRPKELDANLHLIRSKGKYYAVVVGLFNSKPYEVFVIELLADDYNIMKEDVGKVIKVKKEHYKFEGKHITIEKLSEGNSILEKAVALYTSMLLRHGVGMKYLLKTSKKIDDNISSFTSAMNRVLSKYIPKEITEDTCPDCGQKMIFENGCKHCSSCSYSKCNMLITLK